MAVVIAALHLRCVWQCCLGGDYTATNRVNPIFVNQSVNQSIYCSIYLSLSLSLCVCVCVCVCVYSYCTCAVRGGIVEAAGEVFGREDCRTRYLSLSL